MSRGLCRTLAIEQLEPKQMLAGDVAVSLVGGNLRIVGDAADNQISITQGADQNSYLITGLNGTNVTMNGATSSSATVGNVRGLVNVSMGAGNDSVSVANATFKLALNIETGAGNDTVLIGSPAAAQPGTAAAVGNANVNVRGALNVITGSENDVVRMADVAVGGFLNILTLEGDDTVQLGATATPGLTAALTDGTTTSSVRAGLAVDVALGDGTDTAQLNSVSALGAINVGGGLGADQMNLQAVRAASLLVSGGFGEVADVVTIGGAKAVAAVIGTGGGNDQASISDSVFTALEVALGAGDDSLTLSAVTSKQAFLAGGEGASDQLTDVGSTITRKTVTGFEIPADVNTTPPFRPAGRMAWLFDLLRR